MGCPYFVGQKVKCNNVDWNHKSRSSQTTVPVYGEIYTIRRIFVCKKYTYILLHEIINPKVNTAYGKVEQGFYFGRFTPVNQLSTESGMKLLRELLDSAQNLQTKLS